MLSMNFLARGPTCVEPTYRGGESTFPQLKLSVLGCCHLQHWGIPPDDLSAESTTRNPFLPRLDPSRGGTQRVCCLKGEHERPIFTWAAKKCVLQWFALNYDRAVNQLGTLDRTGSHTPTPAHSDHNLCDPSEMDTDTMILFYRMPPNPSGQQSPPVALDATLKMSALQNQRRSGGHDSSIVPKLPL